MTIDTRHTALMEIGRNAYASLAEMVAALQLNWDRLGELRSERDDWDNEDHLWESSNPEEADELAQLEATAGDCANEDDARQRIIDDPLELSLRTGWYMPGITPEPEEFCLLLCTGGPAVRIRGELNEYKEPTRAYLQVQDWGTPWTDYPEADGDTLLTYAQQLFYGD